MSKMFVVKRDGRQEQVHFDKITARITKLSYGLSAEFCDPVGTFLVQIRNLADVHAEHIGAPCHAVENISSMLLALLRWGCTPCGANRAYCAL